MIMREFLLVAMTDDLGSDYGSEIFPSSLAMLFSEIMKYSIHLYLPNGRKCDFASFK
jgi:hypothetical protein